MQPTYLPWMGYFSLIDQVDTFVLLNDVQFEHQSFQHKNRILSKDAELWLTVPVYTKNRFRQLIMDVEIDAHRNWQRKHLQSIKLNYSKSTSYKFFIKNLESIYNKEWNHLQDLNYSIIKAIMSLLGINTPIIFSSELNAPGSRIDRIINICKSLNASEYLSPLGAFNYIENETKFLSEDIKLLYQNYVHPVYNQLDDEFHSHLSIIDAIFNLGAKTMEVLRSGNRKSFSHLDLIKSNHAEKTHPEDKYWTKNN